jgi:hypothetical protein
MLVAVRTVFVCKRPRQKVRHRFFLQRKRVLVAIAAIALEAGEELAEIGDEIGKERRR